VSNLSSFSVMVQKQPTWQEIVDLSQWSEQEYRMAYFYGIKILDNLPRRYD